MQIPFARAVLFTLLPAALFGPSCQDALAGETQEVNVYSYRQPYLIDPLLKKFTEETGIKVNVIFAEKGLIERIAAEGRNSPADLLLTVDVGNLMQAKEAGVGQVVRSPELEKEIPAAYRDKDGIWWGLTRRARVVYAAKDRVKLTEITYEDLADPKWKGKICIRSGQQTYTEQWLKGVKE